MSAPRSRRELELAEREERLRAMRDGRYRANVGFIIGKTRSLILIIALASALLGWPFAIPPSTCHGHRASAHRLPPVIGRGGGRDGCWLLTFPLGQI
ncbi:MAG: hypothetical protein ACLP01_18780 [Solirubrobacteraceae bacterium]